uniref:Carboxypeptidase n=1 Tax=Oxyrrhis marina TaxID=2969 RepID=A0A7S3UJE1_OXYMA
MTGLFLENGPCTINRNGTDTELNPYSWNTQANLLFVDQPAGAGFAMGPPVTNGSFEAADDLYLALQNFFEKHDQYRSNDFYITGESYAGHYIPAIAHKIWRENVRGVEPNIPLRGIAIGNGWMKAAVQVLHYPEMAFQSGTAPHVITRKEYLSMSRQMVSCSKMISSCLESNGDKCPKAENCSEGAFPPLEMRGIDVYDMRITCRSDDCSGLGGGNMQTYLNKKSVQSKLGVRKRFEECSNVGDFSRELVNKFERPSPK